MADEITLDAPETRIERFLAAAAGVDGITLDEPVTRIEKYLYKIAQGSGGVPAVEDADKGKFLHANESTGDLEWATAGGSGGGALVVNVTYENESDAFVADKSMSEVLSAIASGNPVLCKYNSLISFFTKEEDYPEVCASLFSIEQGIDEQGHGGLYVRMYYFEYAEDGTFSGEESVAMISI